MSERKANAWGFGSDVIIIKLKKGRAQNREREKNKNQSSNEIIKYLNFKYAEVAFVTVGH